MTTRQDDGDRAGVADLVVLERVQVHQQRRHVGLVAGPAVRRVVDDVERAQGVDRRQHERHHELVAQAGQGDREELAHRAGAVDPGGVVERGRDLLHAGHEQHHAEPEGDPGADRADGAQRPVEVAQPAARPVVRREHRQRRVERAILGVEPDEGLRDHDAGDHLRQEQHGAEEREAADRMTRHARRSEPARARPGRTEYQRIS